MIPHKENARFLRVLNMRIHTLITKLDACKFLFLLDLRITWLPKDIKHQRKKNAYVRYCFHKYARQLQEQTKTFAFKSHLTYAARDLSSAFGAWDICVTAFIKRPQRPESGPQPLKILWCIPWQRKSTLFKIMFSMFSMFQSLNFNSLKAFMFKDPPFYNEFINHTFFLQGL